MKIITNNVPRDIIYGYELTDAEREEFDYLDDIEMGQFFRYRGELYDIGEFMGWDNPDSPTRQGWQGYYAESYFSAIVIRYCDEYERVIVGLALS